jgi:hypothetical protein
MFGKVIGCTLGTVLGMALVACELKDITSGSGNEPATRATVIGTWRTNIPIPGQIKDMKVTMRIDANDTMLVSQRMGNPMGEVPEFVETSNEMMTWALVDGKLKSTKYLCKYADAPPYQLKEDTCKDPLVSEEPVNVKGGAWTIMYAGKPIVFRKD